MIDGTEAADRICFGETDRSLHEEATTHEVDGIRGKWRWVKRGPWKLVRIPRAGGRIEWLLFDLGSDPLETRNLAGARPDMVSDLARELEAWIAEDHQEDRDYHVSPELHEQLRSLGYVN
jgi:arylsulfatase A-like enzyme